MLTEEQRRLASRIGSLSRFRPDTDPQLQQLRAQLASVNRRRRAEQALDALDPAELRSVMAARRRRKT